MAFSKGNPYASAGGKARAKKLSKKRRQAIAKQGWTALVQQRFKGNEALCKAWWGAIGAWFYDAPYRQDGLGKIPHPGTPEEFIRSRSQR